MNEVSNLFVCLMGMGTTFVGLICIIFLTMLIDVYKRQAACIPTTISTDLSLRPRWRRR